jgi:hypothetical protein
MFGPENATMSQILKTLKFLPVGKPSLDGLPLLKTKNNIIIKSVGHLGCKSCIL